MCHHAEGRAGRPLYPHVEGSKRCRQTADSDRTEGDGRQFENAENGKMGTIPNYVLTMLGVFIFQHTPFSFTLLIPVYCSLTSPLVLPTFTG